MVPVVVAAAIIAAVTAAAAIANGLLKVAICDDGNDDECGSLPTFDDDNDIDEVEVDDDLTDDGDIDALHDDGSESFCVVWCNDIGCDDDTCVEGNDGNGNGVVVGNGING